jgi:uncharacterized damage-inducible protein DinB
MQHDNALREQLGRLLSWKDAHVDFHRAVSGIPEEARGEQPAGLPWSPWQLLEHLRRTQRDILDFCRDPDYREPDWPDDYWPPTPAPPSAGAWERRVRDFLDDRAALQALTSDPAIDLFAVIPHGDGQTYLREIVLAADHTAYHVGQLVVVRRLLGVWE